MLNHIDSNDIFTNKKTHCAHIEEKYFTQKYTGVSKHKTHYCTVSLQFAVVKPFLNVYKILNSLNIVSQLTT